MSHRERDRGAKYVERRVAKGRGQGEGADYRPWHYIHELSSKGVSHKIDGVKVDRTHHVLSDLERDILHVLEYAPAVIDIREQFPLLPYGLTSQLAKALKIPHPKEDGSRDDKVLSTDFLLTLGSKHGTRQVALSAKYTSDLAQPGTRARLEIERRFWMYRKVPWYLVTERELSKSLNSTVKWLRAGALLPDKLAPVLEPFLTLCKESDWKDLQLRSVLNDISATLDIPDSDGVALFKHAAWTRRIILNPRDKVALLQPLKEISYSDSAAAEIRLGAVA